MQSKRLQRAGRKRHNSGLSYRNPYRPSPVLRDENGAVRAIDNSYKHASTPFGALEVIVAERNPKPLYLSAYISSSNKQTQPDLLQSNAFQKSSVLPKLHSSILGYRNSWQPSSVLRNGNGVVRIIDNPLMHAPTLFGSLSAIIAEGLPKSLELSARSKCGSSQRKDNKCPLRKAWSSSPHENSPQQIRTSLVMVPLFRRHLRTVRPLPHPGKMWARVPLNRRYIVKDGAIIPPTPAYRVRPLPPPARNPSTLVRQSYVQHTHAGETAQKAVELCRSTPTLSRKWLSRSETKVATSRAQFDRCRANHADQVWRLRRASPENSTEQTTAPGGRRRKEPAVWDVRQSSVKRSPVKKTAQKLQSAAVRPAADEFRGPGVTAPKVFNREPSDACTSAAS
nr:hypothetical protein Iba_chr04cCG14360 [Ipomoea batatas]